MFKIFGTPKKHINVRFVDVSTGQVFAESQVPVEQLPETFQLQTTMHLGDQDWSVVRAEPSTSAEFTKSGHLTLTLSRVQTLPIKDILFSLPTISNEIASRSQIPKTDQSALEMHEDDWRQIEFVSKELIVSINSEVTEIRRVIESGMNKSGFEKCHVRQGLSSPLPELKFDVVASIFSQNMNTLDGVCYFQYPNLIADGFAFRSGDLSVYGVQSNGMVNVLGFREISVKPAHLENLVLRVQTLMTQHELLLVDWCRAQVVPDDAAVIRQYLQS